MDTSNLYTCHFRVLQATALYRSCRAHWSLVLVLVIWHGSCLVVHIAYLSLYAPCLVDTDTDTDKCVNMNMIYDILDNDNDNDIDI